MGARANFVILSHRHKKCGKFQRTIPIQGDVLENTEGPKGITSWRVDNLWLLRRFLGAEYPGTGTYPAAWTAGAGLILTDASSIDWDEKVNWISRAARVARPLQRRDRDLVLNHRLANVADFGQAVIQHRISVF